MAQLSYCHTLSYTNPPAEALADHLVASAGAPFARAYLVGSGSEAVESALKLAAQHFWERGQAGRVHFVARRQSYHGNTLGAMSLTDAPARTRPYEGVRMANAHAVASAAALAVQRIIKRDGLVENSKRMGEVLERLLLETLGEKKFVGNVRGRGCFYAVEFVKDKRTKESLDPALKFAFKIQEKALDMGVHLYPMSGTVDGKRGDHILLAPAITVDEEMLRKIVGVLEAAYNAAEREVTIQNSA
ncbi:hypothetical protein SLS57_012435 [Botryosphaeria dothidea]